MRKRNKNPQRYRIGQLSGASRGGTGARVSSMSANQTSTMEKEVATVDKGALCCSWNYCGQRLAVGFVDGSVSIHDNLDSASSCSSKWKVCTTSPSLNHKVSESHHAILFYCNL